MRPLTHSTTTWSPSPSSSPPSPSQLWRARQGAVHEHLPITVLPPAHHATRPLSASRPEEVRRLPAASALRAASATQRPATASEAAMAAITIASRASAAIASAAPPASEIARPLRAPRERVLDQEGSPDEQQRYAPTTI